MPNLTNAEKGIIKVNSNLKQEIEALQNNETIDVTHTTPKKKRALGYLAQSKGIIEQRSIIKRTKELRIIGENSHKITIQTE